DGGVGDGQRQIGANIGRGIEVDGGAVGECGIAGVVGDVEDRRDGAVSETGQGGAVGAVAVENVDDNIRVDAVREGDRGRGQIAVQAGDREASRAGFRGIDGG